MIANKQIQLLSTSIWRELSNNFKATTGKTLELKDTIFSKGKDGSHKYQQITYYFKCDGIRAGISLAVNSKTLNNIKNNKDVYDEIIKETFNVMLEEYNKYIESDKGGLI